MFHNHWLSIPHNDSQPMAQHSTPWFKTTGSAQLTMTNKKHGLSITHHDSEQLAQQNTP
jgi:hypothetical protein